MDAHVGQKPYPSLVHHDWLSICMYVFIVCPCCHRSIWYSTQTEPPNYNLWWSELNNKFCLIPPVWIEEHMIILYAARSSKKHVHDSSGNMEDRLIKLCWQGCLAERCLNKRRGGGGASEGHPHFTYLTWSLHPDARWDLPHQSMVIALCVVVHAWHKCGGMPPCK